MVRSSSISFGIVLTVILSIVTIVQSCGIWRNNLIVNGDEQDAIHNAILDFINTSKLFKDDSTFLIEIASVEDVYVIAITGTINRIIITEDGRSSPLPNNLVKINGKVFYWLDPNQSTQEAVLQELAKYGIVDSIPSIAFATLVNDDEKRGIDYFVCKNDLTIYKKVKSRSQAGYYPKPNLNCPAQ